MNNLNFDPIVLTQNLVRCPSITPKDSGALDIIENHLNNYEPLKEDELLQDKNEILKPLEEVVLEC